MKQIMNIFKSTAILLIVIPSITSCSKESCEEKIKDDCGCITVYDPVCGCNNKTYPSPCDAECNGIDSYKKGACK